MAIWRVDERRELGAVQLGQAVDGVARGARARVLEAVPARVVGRVAQPEVGPEVDDRGAVGDEVRDEAGRRAVREGEERGVDLGQRVPDREVGRGEVRVVAADRIVVAVAAGEPDDVDVRMARQQPDQLGADVAGRADDADADPARPAVRATPRSERGRNPDDWSVAIAAGDPSPALTGARGRSRAAGSGGSPGRMDRRHGRMTIQQSCIVMQAVGPSGTAGPVGGGPGDARAAAIASGAPRPGPLRRHPPRAGPRPRAADVSGS